MASRWLIVCLLGLSPAALVAGGEPPEVWGSGELRELRVSPPQVEIMRLPGAVRFVLTGIYANGGRRDLTRQASIQIRDEEVARLAADGCVEARADGETIVTLSAGERRVDVPLRVTAAARRLPVHFANDIVPIFSKHGCNSGGCHGKSGGQNGFQLSLFGFYPQMDYTSLTRGSRGRRVFPAHPPHSLLLKKATGTLTHGGGSLLAPDSAEFRLLQRWMADGVPYGRRDAPTLEQIRVFPRHRVLPPAAQQQLNVTAIYSDGRKEDVTRLAEYSANEADYLMVSEDGLVTTLDRAGQGAVLVRFRGIVDTFRATIPTGEDISGYSFPAAANFVDELVFARLRELGIPPSKPASDEVFLRRASLLICGTLPSPAEVQSFLGDTSDDKYERCVDRLLDRDEYAAYFALFWADILRNRRGNQQAAPLSMRFHHWIHQNLLANRSLAAWVRDVICAEGSIADSPQVAWYRELETPKALVDDTAQVFLGTRIQCARCHHHPHEKWSQNDYWQFANFFARVRRRNNSDSRDFLITLERGTSRLRDDEATSASFNKTYVGLRVLGGEEIDEKRDGDPRQLLVDWMVGPENPFFARALVNRYWKHFFGRGIVEPEDDIRETNPPANPALLNALAADFVKSGHDLKHLIRTICTSTTFRLSAEPNRLNRLDEQNYSRFQPRRLPAEVLLDAINKVLGAESQYDGMRRGARAIELADEGVDNFFLDLFGKPARTTACACERTGEVTLSQMLHLLNSEEVQRKIRGKDAPPARYARDSRDVGEQLDELFVSVFGRAAKTREIERARTLLAPADKNARRAVWEDIVWALLNSKEFLFVR